jgi:hypothetical protein
MHILPDNHHLAEPDYNHTGQILSTTIVWLIGVSLICLCFVVLHRVIQSPAAEEIVQRKTTSTKHRYHTSSSYPSHQLPILHRHRPRHSKGRSSDSVASLNDQPHNGADHTIESNPEHHSATNAWSRIVLNKKRSNRP